jgi:hypothetical protein
MDVEVSGEETTLIHDSNLKTASIADTDPVLPDFVCLSLSLCDAGSQSLEKVCNNGNIDERPLV